MPDTERLDLSRTALIAYDVCRRALTPDDPVRREAMRPVLDAWVKMIAAARAAGIPVIYTTRHVDTGGVHSTNRNMKKEREDIYDIKAELAPQPGELVIYKERASGFFGTPLIAHLQMLKINSLIICGESTSGCVRASTVDAYSYGFHNTLVEECTYDRSMLSHKVNLFDLHHKYADVMHIDEVLNHLDGMAINRPAA